MEFPLIAFFQIQVILLKAKFYLAFGNFELAKGLVKNALTKFPNNLTLLSTLQGIYLSNGEWDEYLNIFKLANALIPQDLNINRNTGTALLHFNRYLEALPYLKFCIDHWNLDFGYSNLQANMYAQLGICYAYLQDWDLARQALQMAQELSPQDSDMVYGLMLVYIGTSRHDEIPSFLDSVIKKDPDNYAFYYWRATTMHYFFYDPVNALKWYELSLNRISVNRAKEFASRYYSIRSNVVPGFILQEYMKALVNSGKEREAATVIRWNRLRLWDDSLDIYALQIDLDVLTGKLDKGKAKCETKIKQQLRPGKLAEYLSLLARIQVKQDRIDDAFDSINNCLALDPYNHPYWEILGAIQLEKQDWENAINAFDKIIAIDPFNPDAWENIGQCYVNLQNLQKARIAYEKAVQLGPYNAQAWIDLGRIYNNLGEYPLAESACKKGLGFSYLDQEKRLIGEDILNSIGNAL